MSFSYQPKSTIVSLLYPIKFLRKFVSYFPNFIKTFLKFLDWFLTFIEAFLFTLLLRFIFHIPIPNVEESIQKLISNFSYDNDIIIFIIQIAIVQFLKESINSRIRYKYAFYNSQKLNLEYVSGSIDDELKYHINEKYKNPSEINILCISGQDTFVNKTSYLHDYIEQLEPNGLEVNIVLCDCRDDETVSKLKARSRNLNTQVMTNTNYNSQIEDALEYCKTLIDKGMRVNFYLNKGIPEFKIVVIDRVVIVQNYASSVNSNNKTVFVISRSNSKKDENNSIFEAYNLYFNNKVLEAERIHIRHDTTIECIRR